MPVQVRIQPLHAGSGGTFAFQACRADILPRDENYSLISRMRGWPAYSPVDSQ